MVTTDTKDIEPQSDAGRADSVDNATTLETHDDDASPRDYEEEPGILQPGATVGRYTVLNRLGSGGMGIVYAAFDPELDRRVALKVMHPRSKSRSDGSHKSRLLREAQAMAKLAHPNVITVHDVGMFAERVFVAMEFVDGFTLREWLEGETHDWSAIVDAFVCAGRGLAAAHAANLIHRDFKPDNVLMGRDGRVLVTDFGLARRANSRVLTSDFPAGVTEAPSGELDTEIVLTRTGALLGTPAYMSPEQHRGVEVGPLTDQFSFCVALYEALYGERPFAGNTITSLALNVIEGDVRPPPRDHRVPDWLRKVILRGLEPEPMNRFPSMDALLAELQRDPPQRRTPWLTALIAAGVGSALLVIAYVNQPPPKSLCDDQPHIRDIWTEARKQSIRTAFSTTNRPYVEATYRSTVDHLDELAKTWDELFQQRCSVAKPNRPDPGLTCLDEQRDSLSALITALETGSENAVDHAVLAVQQHPSPDRCRTENVAPAPTRRRADLLTKLHRAEALSAVGDHQKASDFLDDAPELLAASDAPQLKARALTILATAHQALGHDVEAVRHRFEQALFVAARSGSARLEALGWQHLIEHIGLYQHEIDEARALIVASEAALARVDQDPALQASLMLTMGDLSYAEGRPLIALEHFERANKALRSLSNVADLKLAKSSHAVGLALAGSGRFLEAIERHKAGLVQREQLLGAQHPLVGNSLVYLASSQIGAQRVEDAESTLVRARMLLDPDGTLVSSSETLRPAQVRSIAIMLQLQGHIARTKRDFTTAAKLYSDAASLLERNLEPNSIDLGYALVNAGLALSDQGHSAEAVQPLHRALVILTTKLDEFHPDLGVAHLNLANALWAIGDSKRAKHHYQNCLAIWEHSLDTDHPLLAYPLSGWGRTALELELIDEALPPLQHAERIRRHQAEDTFNVAESNYLLAIALVKSGAEDALAFRHLRVALKLAGDTEMASDDDVRAIAWGKQHSIALDQITPAGLTVTLASTRDPF